MNQRTRKLIIGAAIALVLTSIFSVLTLFRVSLALANAREEIRELRAQSQWQRMTDLMHGQQAEVSAIRQEVQEGTARKDN